MAKMANQEILDLISSLVEQNQSEIAKALGASLSAKYKVAFEMSADVSPSQEIVGNEIDKVVVDEIAVTEANKDILGSWS